MIFVKKGEDQFALGTLDKERCPHFSLDIHLATECIALSHTGKSNVYLTGYEAVSVAAEDEDDGGLPFLQGLMRGGEASDEGARRRHWEALPAQVLLVLRLAGLA